jgi:arylsulfatase A-like enzyme
MMPTFCDLAGADKCPKTDGISISRTLLGQNKQKEHEYLYWEFNESEGPLQAVRKDEWKLVRKYKKKPELYNLSVDIGETNNIATNYPDIVKELTDTIDFARTYHPEFTLEKLVSPWKKKAEAEKLVKKKVVK